MAYHYLLNTGTGEVKTIRSESLETYASPHSGWRVFDTIAERDAHVPPTWYCINYASRRSAVRINPSQAAAYWQRVHLLAGWAVFDSLEKATAALAAMPLRYQIAPESGALRTLPLWLPEAEREAAGFVGDFASHDDARRAHPPSLCALHIEDGGDERIYPAQRRDYESSGYIIRATLDECRACLPIRYRLDDDSWPRRYRSTTSGRVMRAASAFAMLRGALRAIQAEQEVFTANSWRGLQNGNVASVLQVACNNTVSRHVPSRFDYNESYHRQAVNDFAARINVMSRTLACSVCDDCHNALVVLRGGRQIEGRNICSNCAGSYMACTRAGCGRLMHESDSREDSRGNTVCRDHWNPVVMEASGGMLSYSTDVTRRLDGFRVAKGEKADPKKTLWLGWELECHAKGAETDRNSRLVFDEDCDDCGGSGEYENEDGDNVNCSCGVRSGNRSEAVAKIVRAAADWCIVKEDGSLDNGMEIVSVPASLRWHRENVAPFLQSAQEYLSGWAHNDCGIHVHVGRKQLSELQQSKLVRFMHEPRNQSFITRVAGRDPNSYCNRGGVKAFGAFKREAQIGRYQALNFATRNQKTIEFRIFRSNVSPAGFIKNLEFVHALCMWSRFASAGDVASGSLVEYVKSERSQYGSLVKWFENQTILPAPKRHPDAPVPAFTIAA